MTETKSALTGHVLGATYESGYWGERYTVEDIDKRGWVTVRWHTDDRVSTHCTRLEERDRRVIALHAHMESREVDCDGPLDRDWVMTVPEADVSDDDLERAFRQQVLASLVNVQPMHTAQLNVTSFEDGTSRLSWHEHTDEGYRAVEATFCTDETCDLKARSQRDHYAEAMGY